MADTSIVQHADLKVLMPILQEALKSNEGGAINLNMVGPFYFGSNEHEEKQSTKNAAIEIREVSSDDLFSTDMTAKKFKERAFLTYLRIVASKYDFNREKVIEVLGSTDQSVSKWAKKAGITWKSTKKVGGLITSGVK